MTFKKTVNVHNHNTLTLIDNDYNFIDYNKYILISLIFMFLHFFWILLECSSPSIDEENFKDQLFFNTVEILPKHKGIVVEFVMENTLTIYASGGSTKYMNVEFIEQTLRISTTLEFNNYELNEIDTFMTIELNFECIDGTRRLNFYQNIKVVNNYAPLFSKLSYEIKIPTPLPQGLDITMFIMVCGCYSLMNN